jgi:hypothetical protein
MTAYVSPVVVGEIKPVTLTPPNGPKSAINYFL